MPFPAIQPIPGNTNSIVDGAFHDLVEFTTLNHYQISVKLNAIPGGATIELRLQTKDPNDGLYYTEEPAVTYGPGAPANRDVHTFPFLAATGIKVQLKQTGGAITNYKWYCYKV